jgi:hypothetical protein
MASAALEPDRSRRSKCGKFDMPQMGCWIEESESINMAGFIAWNLAHDESDRLLIGLGVVQNYFGIQPQFFGKKNRDSIPVDRQCLCALEELLSEDICSDDFNRKLKFGRRRRKGIVHGVLPFLTRSGVFAKPAIEDEDNVGRNLP